MQQIEPPARRVEDLALLLPILAGPDNLDAAIAPVQIGDYRKVDLRALRVAWYVSNGQVDPTAEIAKGVSDCVNYLTAAGAKCKEARPPMLQELGELRGTLSGGEGVRRRLRRAGTKQSSPQPPRSGGWTIAAAGCWLFSKTMT